MQAITTVLASIMCLAAVSAHSAGIDAIANATPGGTLIDANGKKMGVFYPSPMTATTGALGLINVHGSSIFIRLDPYIHDYAGPNQWTDNQLLVAYSNPFVDWVWFASTNCTGSPYLTIKATPSAGSVPSTVLSDANGNAVAYIAKGGQPPVTLAAASYLSSSDGACVPQLMSLQFYSVVQKVVLGDLYVAPYSVK